MGFVYKLTPQICSFIIDQKRAQPKLSCQAISGMIFSTYGQQVSKSSVHELLKQSQVIIPRARKTKEKFEIPQHKKEQISKALAPFSIMGGAKSVSVIQEPPKPAIITEPLVPTVVTEIKKTEPSMIKPLVKARCGEIFIKAVLHDLSLKPILGIKEFSNLSEIKDFKNKTEWEYLNQQAQLIKIENFQGEVFYVDPRFQMLSDQLPATSNYTAPIERAVCEAADLIVNNIKPLLINRLDVNFSKEKLIRFIETMNNAPGKGLKNVIVLGFEHKILSEFKYLLTHPRKFSIKIDSKHVDIKEFTEIKDLKIAPCSSGENGIFIISNLKQMSYEEINRDIKKRFPRNIPPELGKNKIVDEGNFNLAQALKDLAKGMFFPALAKENFERILELNGYEQHDHETVLEVNLTEPWLEDLKKAMDLFNAIDISDFNGKKLTLKMSTSSV